MGNPQGATSVPSNNLYNSISAKGVQQTTSPEQSQQSNETNPAEAAITQFSETFNSVQSLLEKPEFAMASKEADLVKKAMQNWLETVVGSLSQPAQSQGGGSLL